jgi:hypothetical protein
MRSERAWWRVRWEELGLALYLSLLVLFLALVLRARVTRRHFAPMTVHPLDQVADTGWAADTEPDDPVVRPVSGSREE